MFAVTFYGYQSVTPTVSGRTAAVGDALFAPNGVKASDGNYADKIGVMWETVRGANLYRIFRNTTNNSASATDVGTTQANYFFDANVPNTNQNYFYWVRAENGAATSILSASDTGLRAVGTDNPDIFFPPLLPTPAPTGNGITASKAALGKALFWDEQMSSTQTVACGTCHRPATGGSDPRTIVGNVRSTNPGFDNTFNTADDVFGSPGVPMNNADGSYSFSNSFGLSEQVTPRKAPSYINAGYPTEGLFWDGRASDTFRDPITNAVLLDGFAALESQVIGPPLSSGEMAHGNRNWTQVAAQIVAAKPLALATKVPQSLSNWINGRTYPQLFEEAFGTADVTPARIAMAIATHERTLFSDQTPLDKWSAEIQPLTTQEQRGMNVFRSSCSICHTGSLLTNQRFHNIGVRPANEDSGRGAISGISDDNGRFKVPNLRNVELHAPYMHNGRFATLEQVVDFYDRGGDFNAPNLDIDPLGLSNQQKADLVAFLKRPLTDTRVANELPPFDRPKLYSESPRVPVITGTGRAGSGGIIPKVTAVEPPFIGNPNFTVGISQALGNAQGYLVIDTTDPGAGTSIPAGGAFPPFQVFMSGTGNGKGYGSVSFALPNNPDLIGQSFYGRWYIQDAGAVNGFSVSPPFRFTLFPAATNINKTHVDFDGDRKTDISIFRPSNGEWWYLKSGNGANAAFQFGAGTDKIVPADYTGDGKTDVAIFRPSNGNWYILRSDDFSYYSYPFGTSTDIPTVGDFDADGKADSAVFRPSDTNWYIRRSSDSGFTIRQFGATGDVPVAADYDADGKTDMAIYRPSLGQWWLNRSTEGVIAFTFGNSADKPVQGDYTGDGKTDVAIWRPSTGEWFVLRSEDYSYYSVPFGANGDIPAPGDYDGDGKADTAIFRPSGSTWYVNRSTQGVLIQGFGISGDYPAPAAFVPSTERANQQGTKLKTAKGY
ncbi:MAG: cytochrome c peroxidase [Pyrinomonadaceae bacterium]